MSEKTENINSEEDNEHNEFDFGNLFSSLFGGNSNDSSENEGFNIGKIFSNMFGSNEEEKEPEISVVDNIKENIPFVNEKLTLISRYSISIFVIFFTLYNALIYTNTSNHTGGFTEYLLFFLSGLIVFSVSTLSLIAFAISTGIKFLISQYSETILEKYKDKIELLKIIL